MSSGNRVSEIFSLKRSQGSLDFVNVDVTGDTALFISPRALQLLPSEWGDECVYLVRTFFQRVLALIREGKHDQAETLLCQLKEPNETHLGLSKGQSRGRALGTESAKDVWRALSRSQAAKSGLLQDLEDTALMIEGVGVDIISDMTTNIIRKPLIDYTQKMAERYDIPLEPDIDSGPLWNPLLKRWEATYVDLPMTGVGKLLLVPKVIVRAGLQYRFDKYFQHYLLTHLQQFEFEARSSL